jgi:hypothetical protein
MAVIKSLLLLCLIAFWKLSNSYAHKKQFRKTIINTQLPKVGEKFSFFLLANGLHKSVDDAKKISLCCNSLIAVGCGYGLTKVNSC